MKPIVFKTEAKRPADQALSWQDWFSPIFGIAPVGDDAGKDPHLNRNLKNQSAGVRTTQSKIQGLIPQASLFLPEAAVIDHQPDPFHRSDGERRAR